MACPYYYYYYYYYTVMYIWNGETLSVVFFHFELIPLHTFPTLPPHSNLTTVHSDPFPIYPPQSSLSPLSFLPHGQSCISHFHRFTCKINTPNEPLRSLVMQRSELWEEFVYIQTHIQPAPHQMHDCTIR